MRLRCILGLFSAWTDVIRDMSNPAASLAERLAEAREEAHALVLYFARHCPGGLEADASQAYSDILAALSPAEGTAEEDAYSALMAAYRRLACRTFAAHGVHGRSVLDTTRPCPSFWARLWDKRFRAVTLGVLFFVSALVLHWIEARSQAMFGVAKLGTTEIEAGAPAARAQSQALAPVPSAKSDTAAAGPPPEYGATAARRSTEAEAAPPVGSPKSGVPALAASAEAKATAAVRSGVSAGASLVASCVVLLIPVAWGALGACTALAKRVSDRLAAMSYEENRMQGLPARIFLGAALALVLNILVFVESVAPAEDAPTLGFGPIAAAFLAGLFVQHIYGALETMMGRVSRAISPETPAPRAEPPAGEQPRDRQR